MKSFSILLRGTLAATLVVSLGVPAVAGERVCIRGMSMARTSVASARGLGAIGVNPANLAIDDGRVFLLGLLPLGVHVGSDFLDYDTYTSYFTGVETDSGRVGRYLTEQDEERILSGFDGPIGHSVFNFEARILGLAYRNADLGAVALTVSERLGASAEIPKDYLEFAFKGNPPGSSYSFSGAKVEVTWMREYALSFGTELPGGDFLEVLSAGLTLKLIHGYSYYEIRRFNTTLTTDERATLTGSLDFLSRSAGMPADRLSYAVFPSVAGKGIGVDVGFLGIVNEYLSVGLSVTDLGSVRWTRDTFQERSDTAIVVDDPLAEEQRRSVEDAVRGKRSPSGPFSVGLPLALRMGIALQVDRLPEMEGMQGDLLLELDYNQYLLTTAYSTVTPRVSVGIEYKPIPWLPLRSGVSLGGTDALNLALGFGIDFEVFTFEVGSENVTALFAPRSFSHGSLAIGAEVRL